MTKQGKSFTIKCHTDNTYTVYRIHPTTRKEVLIGKEKEFKSLKEVERFIDLQMQIEW